jgi:Ser/Thr protein kinase RdoA (MazF antagonist)
MSTLEKSVDRVFGLAAAREAAAHWGYGADAELELLCISENATYVVRDAGGAGPAVLRLNRPGYHHRDALASELAWTAALRSARVVCTPEWVPTRDGEPVAALTPVSPAGPPRHAVLFSFAPGKHPADAAGAALVEIGELAARLHAHSRSWSKPQWFQRFSWNLPAALGDGAGKPGRWGDWRTGYTAAERDVLQTAETQLRQALVHYGQAPERFGLIHADLRASNLLVDDQTAESGVTVIDFDDCGYSWFLYDLAASVSFLEHLPELPELVSGWLEGYRRTTRDPLEAADLAVVPALVMLRRLQLQAWSSSHADTEMVRSLGARFAEQTVEVADRYLSAGWLTDL